MFLGSTESRILLFATAAAMTIALPAAAMPPEQYTLDNLGVDLATGAFTTSRTVLAIGPAGSPDQLVLTIEYNSQETRDGPFGKGWSHSLELWAERRPSGSTRVVDVVAGMVSAGFKLSGSTYVPDRRNGAALIPASSSALANLTFYSRNGDVIVFEPDDNTTCASFANTCRYHATSWTKPNGEKLTFAHPKSWSGSSYTTGRLSSVTSTLGWNISFGYNGAGHMTWAQAVNLAVDYCGNVNGAPWCNLSSWPKVTFAYTSAGQLASLTDLSGQVWSFGYDTAGRMTWLRRPGDSTNFRTLTYASSGKVTKQTVTGIGSWTYSYTSTTTTATDPAGHKTTVTFSNGRPVSVKDPLNRVTSFAYDGFGRLIRQTRPEGDSVELTYDNRGNVTQTKRNPKPNSGLAAIVTTAGFRADTDAECTPAPTPLCNQPLWVRDPLGNQTDFTYNTSAKAVATVTLPANGSGIRPRQRFSYAQLWAYVKTASGGVAAAAAPVWRLIETAGCPTATTCASSTEVKTGFGYGAAGVANNRALVTTTVDPGGLNLVTTLTYDRWGNVTRQDGPLSGAADSVYLRYDALRRVVGSIAPDPDGSGPLPRPAVRVSYDAKGLVTRRETGTVTGTSDAAWSAFVVKQAEVFAYDGAGRPVRREVQAGGAVQQVEQTSYDAASRPVCRAVRMNPAVYGALPDACNLSSPGSSGFDRVSRLGYDAAGQLVSVTAAVGLSSEQVSATLTYTANGLLQTVKDAKGNLTTFEYDGFDRLIRRRYPDKWSPGISSASDVETFAYDAAGRITSTVRRDGQVIAFVHDALGEVVKRDLPGTAADVTLSYDALGRVTAVSRNGAGISFSYDRASRLVQTVQAGLSVSYQYDAAGRRTRMTWPDGFYVTFGYDALGRVSEMRENGSALIASFAYDDQGRRTQLSRGNGTTTSYAYDALGRLTRLTHDLAGTAADYDAEFTYDPLGRIVARTQANGLYHWPVATASGTASVNGLDQLASSGGTSLTHDARGNLAGRGAWGYAHDVENQLTQVTGPVNLTLRYDALGRLERLIESGQDTRFVWDGAQVIAELDAASGAVKRRYVPGPGTNEVIAWYEGAGVGERRFIHQDERGSVVAVANGAGAAIATFRYGPWGESSDTAFSRFGYTGAIRLPGTDLLHMRARVYATELARFLEPDPIGFASGQVNLYAYVGGDPINGVDPSGLRRRCFRIVDQNGKVLVEKICLDIEDVVKVTTRRPGPVPGKSSESLTANDVNDLLSPALLDGFGVPTPFAADVSGLTGEAPPSNEIPTEDCAKVTHVGCAYRYDKDGKLQLTPEYRQKVCDAQKALRQGSAKTIDGFFVTGVASIALSSPAGPALAIFSSFGTAVASLTTGAGFQPFGFTVIPPIQIVDCGG
ncbi:MAG: hypothetical protein KatS3mg119_1311 [Rhodothalassiaceae bacterium]|nr:MAG: hypothetical protein KatS3mg119_1311 [Rhodothalassiaceae bacterium]